MLRIFCSDFVATENKMPSIASGDGISSSQSASGHQTAWFGAPGQRSMADIVKMGRPQPQSNTTKQNVNIRSEIKHDHEASANQQGPVKDDWPSIDKPMAPSASSVSVAPGESELFRPADFQSDRGDQHLTDRLENIHIAENAPSADHVQPEDDSGVSTEFDSNPYRYQTQSHSVEHHKGNILNLYNLLRQVSFGGNAHYLKFSNKKTIIFEENQ